MFFVPEMVRAEIPPTFMQSLMVPEVEAGNYIGLFMSDFVNQRFRVSRDTLNILRIEAQRAGLSVPQIVRIALHDFATQVSSGKKMAEIEVKQNEGQTLPGTAPG